MVKISKEYLAYNLIRRVIDKDDTSLTIDYSERIEEMREILERVKDSKQSKEA